MDTKNVPENGQILSYGGYHLNPILAHHRGVTGTETATLSTTQNDEQWNPWLLAYQLHPFPELPCTVYNGRLSVHSHDLGGTDAAVQTGVIQGIPLEHYREFMIRGLSSLVHQRPGICSKSVGELYQEAFRKIHSSSRSKILSKWIDIIRKQGAQKDIVNDVNYDPYAIFLGNYITSTSCLSCCCCCCCHASHLESLYPPLRQNELSLPVTDLQILRLCFGLRKLEICYPLAWAAQ